MGLIALLIVGGMPLLDLLLQPTIGATFSLHVAVQLAFAVGTILLIENLYRNAAEDERWHVSLLCVALAGLSLYDLLLYADAALFRRVSAELFIGRASITALAAPLIALAAARNRRWDINIHVSRQAVFRSATLVISGVFLLGLAAVGEVVRRTGAEWGIVVEVTLVFGGLLAVAVLLTSGSGRSRLRTCWSTISSACAMTTGASGCAASKRCRRPRPMSVYTPAPCEPWPRWSTARPARCTCATPTRSSSAGQGLGTCPPPRLRSRPAIH